MIKEIIIPTTRQGLIEISDQAQDIISQSGKNSGLATFYIQHTSASLLIQENADPDVRTDLQNWFNQLVPENDTLFNHVNEGADDMPAHIKSTLTQTSISIPFDNNKLVLGKWQGLFLWEHRTRNHSRKILIHIL